uniref:Uncharacterized protein n=1 Tax=Romanomermis culicivorax TaxID=13658 RepID=A0A915JFZ9_ROMCU
MTKRQNPPTDSSQKKESRVRNANFTSGNVFQQFWGSQELNLRQHHSGPMSLPLDNYTTW